MELSIDMGDIDSESPDFEAEAGEIVERVAHQVADGYRSGQVLASDGRPLGGWQWQ